MWSLKEIAALGDQAMLDRINDWYLRLFVWLDTWPWWAHFLVVPGFLVALALVAITAALIWIYVATYVAPWASFAVCAAASLVLWAGVAYGVWRITRRRRRLRDSRAERLIPHHGLEALLGQFYVAVLVARLVGLLQTQMSRE